MPRPPVRAKERTECAELKPAGVQLAGVFRGRHEAADVRAPVRDAGQRRVHGDGHVRLQRLPGRIDVARPEERGVTLHPGVAVAVKREDTLVRTELLRAFEVHANASQPRVRVQAVALIRPPAIDADVIKRLVNRPITADSSIVRPFAVWRSPARQGRRRTRFVDRARKPPPFNHGV